MRITAVVGKKDKKLFVYSQLSTAITSFLPILIFPNAGRIPPRDTVGSVSALIRICATIAVVVVLP